MRSLPLCFLLAAACAGTPARDRVDGSQASVITLDPSIPWVMHTIHAGPRGADGVDLADLNHDGLLDVTSAWEQAGLVTVSIHPAAGLEDQPWPTITIVDHFYGAEDAIFADVDDDGMPDVICATEGSPWRVMVVFAPTDPALLLTPAAWTKVTISTGLQRWLKVGFADMDGDGHGDVVAGGKVSPATVGYFSAAVGSPRLAASWAYTVMSEVAWTMSLIPGDVDHDGHMDLVLSDKTYTTPPGLPRRFDLRGSRWLESPTWTNHPIGYSPKEHGFIDLVDWDGDGVTDVLDGGSGPPSTASFRRNGGDWLSWTATPLALPTGAEGYQDVVAGDIDCDGFLDLVYSFNASPGPLSGVVWVDADGGRHEVSGPLGTKYDNAELVDVDGDGDLDVIQSEQIEQLGIVWYENPLAACC